MPDINDLIAGNDALLREREKVVSEFKKLSAALQTSSLAFLFDYADTYPDATLDDLLNQFEDEFHLTQREKSDLAGALRNAQAATSASRAEMYDAFGISAPTNYASLQASFQVDFPRIDRDVRQAVTSKIRELIATKGDVADLTAHLAEHGYIGGKSDTLAITSLAQYDNAYMQEIGKQAGLDTYLYHGPQPQRDYCKRHIGQRYTIEQIGNLPPNGQGLSVMLACGGYRCRHSWLLCADNFLGVSTNQPDVRGAYDSSSGLDDIEAARKFAKDELGVIHIDDNIDAATLNVMNNRLSFWKDQYDFPIKSYRAMVNSDTYLSTDGKGNFRIAMNYWYDHEFLLQKIQEDVDAGQFPIGCNSLNSLIDHEVCHNLTETHDSLIKEIKSVFRTYEKEITDLKSEMAANFTDAQKSNELNDQLSKICISTYADYNAMEFASESFRSYLYTPEPSPFAKTIYTLIEKYHKGMRK